MESLLNKVGKLKQMQSKTSGWSKSRLKDCLQQSIMIFDSRQVCRVSNNFIVRCSSSWETLVQRVDCRPFFPKISVPQQFCRFCIETVYSECSKSKMVRFWGIWVAFGFRHCSVSKSKLASLECFIKIIYKTVQASLFFRVEFK